MSSYELSNGNTYPVISTPWGMNSWTPQTGKMGNGWQYTYTANKIVGFKQTHQPSPWINDYGQFSVMPTVGNMLGVYNKYALGHDIFEIKNDNIISFPNGNFLTNKVYYRNSKEQYKPLNLDEILSEEYINYAKDYTNEIIEVSNGIITHDLIKTSNNKDEAKEIK